MLFDYTMAQRNILIASNGTLQSFNPSLLYALLCGSATVGFAAEHQVSYLVLIVGISVGEREEVMGQLTLVSVEWVPIHKEMLVRCVLTNVGFRTSMNTDDAHAIHHFIYRQPRTDLSQ